MSWNLQCLDWAWALHGLGWMRAEHGLEWALAALLIGWALHAMGMIWTGLSLGMARNTLLWSWTCLRMGWFGMVRALMVMLCVEHGICRTRSALVIC
jgi:hypothetical protein